METQNLVISFDYSWFLAKNLAYAECRIMKFHYRNSSSEDSSIFVAFVENVNFKGQRNEYNDFFSFKPMYILIMVINYDGIVYYFLR